MRRIALFAVPLAMAVLLLVARPFFGQPDIDATGIAGRVTFEDGTPAARVQVSVTVAGRNFAFMTDGQGYYTGEALPGPATVTVGRMTVQAVLERGMTTVANLVVKVGGWQLQIVNPDGTAAPMTSAMIYYKVGDVQRTASPELAVGGRITYGTIPADTTAAAAVVTQNTGRVPRVVIQRWTFDDVQARRTLKVVLDPQVNVTIAVLGAGGVPLANAPLKVTLVGQYAIFMPASLWIPGPLPTQPYSISLPSPMTTDARGQLTFGMLPPGTYRLSMENSDVAGAPLDCVVKDGTVTPATYTLAVKTRTITQTVFGYDGKPAPGTKVRATFARDGKVAQLDAIADAAGKVTWKDLPVSRIIVTGDGVPEGVLDDAVETVTTALPAPAPDARTVSVRFIAPADVTDPIAWRIYSRASGMRR